MYKYIFRYKTRDDFKEDVHLLFTNCKKFNEDESPVGRAGAFSQLANFKIQFLADFSSKFLDWTIVGDFTIN